MLLKLCRARCSSHVFIAGGTWAETLTAPSCFAIFESPLNSLCVTTNKPLRHYKLALGRRIVKAFGVPFPTFWCSC